MLLFYKISIFVLNRGVSRVATQTHARRTGAGAAGGGGGGCDGGAKIHASWALVGAIAAGPAGPIFMAAIEASIVVSPKPPRLPVDAGHWMPTVSEAAGQGLYYCCCCCYCCLYRVHFSTYRKRERRVAVVAAAAGMLVWQTRCYTIWFGFNTK